MMLIDEYATVVKGLDYVSEADARSILEAITNQVRDNLRASIADVWQVQDAQNGFTLFPLMPNGEAQRRDPKQIFVNESSRSILSWVIEKAEPVWLQQIRGQDPGRRFVNRVTNERIEDREFDFFEYTSSLMAVPVVYRGKLRGLISVESSVDEQFNAADLETLRDLALPTGILLWKLDAFQQNAKHTEDAIGYFRTAMNRTTSRLNPYRTGFIARPFREELNGVARRLADIFRERRIRAIEYEHTPGGGVVIREMIAQVAASHFGIIDLTADPAPSTINTNVAIELGMMMGLNKPFLLFRSVDDDYPLPFDISGYHFYRYKFENGDLRIWEPAQSSHRPVEEVIKRFVDDTLLSDEAFQHAREWTGP